MLRGLFSNMKSPEEATSFASRPMLTLSPVKSAVRLREVRYIYSLENRSRPLGFMMRSNKHSLDFRCAGVYWCLIWTDSQDMEFVSLPALATDLILDSIQFSYWLPCKCSYHQYNLRIAERNKTHCNDQITQFRCWSYLDLLRRLLAQIVESLLWQVKTRAGTW